MRFTRAAMLGGLSLGMAGCFVTAATGEASAAVRSGQAANTSSNSFTNDFSSMSQFKGVASSGHGTIAVIMPDTVSSTRYVEFDQPDIAKALTAAGLGSSQFVVQNALGSDANQLTDAQNDISKGASVIVLDPLDSGVGTQIEVYAKQHGVKVIDYDSLTLGGDRTYYVGFDDVAIGKLMAQGLVNCAAAWHVSKPRVVEMRGAVVDHGAGLFAQGSDAVLNRLPSSKGLTVVARTAGTWDPPTAEAEFQAVYGPDKPTAALIPNDETGAPIITYLQSQHVNPRTFPTTGQDATLTGLDNVLAGYQCGTVYKPIAHEAQAAAALALYLRAGTTPPKSLANGTIEDTTAGVSVRAALLGSTWVTARNMKSTVIKDRFVPVAQLCGGQYATDCTAAGIKP